MELVLSHHECRCVYHQYSYMIVERRAIPLSFYDQKITGRLNLLKKVLYADSTEWIERELIALLLEAMGFGLQCRQCWFEFYSCNEHCPPQSSKNCSVPPGEQMYLLSVFFTWLEKEQPSLCDRTKTDRLDWFLKEVPNADPTSQNALKEHLQIFSKGLYIVKTDNLIYRNYCGMNTNHLHLPWVNVGGFTHV